MISVTIQSPNTELDADWDDLVSRAHPNVFMSPVALRAADATMFAKVHVLLAWDDSVQPRRLVGLWALQERRTWALGPIVLDAMPFEYAFVSSPVVDKTMAAAVMSAFVEAIAEAPALPRTILMKSLDIEAASYRPLIDAIGARKGRVLTIKDENRPVLWRGTTEKASRERRKKLRQSWKRMSAIGDTSFVVETEPDAVAAAVETFLQLEFKSWKGAAGTAILCREKDAVFVRRLISDLAAEKQAVVQSLQIDGQTIATQILLFSGTMASTWKTAFDPDYARFSPGVVMIDQMIEGLFEDERLFGIDSCSVEDSVLGHLWRERRAMADMLVGVKPGMSVGFWMEAAWQSGREALKKLRDRLVAMRAARRSKAPVPVITAQEAPTDRQKPRNATAGSDALRQETVSPSIADAVHPFPSTARSDA